jgi:hypothetical protein
MSPSGVDHLIREALMSCWRQLPAEQKTMQAWHRAVEQVFARNMRVWSSIKKPTPDAFFRDLLPNEADGHLRQAMVLCWMMLPRAGGRHFDDTRKIVTKIFRRNVESWEEDNRTFTRPARSKSSATKSPKPARRKSMPTRKPARKSTRKR